MLFLTEENKFVKKCISQKVSIAMPVAKVPSKSFAIMYLFLIFQVSFKEKESKKKTKQKNLLFYYLHQIH